MEEAMIRLGQELRQALETNDLDGAAHAQKRMREIHLERPSSSCRLLIREDCRAAAALLKAGGSVDVSVRIKAARKLGRWLRWGRASTKDLVPTPTALSGLLCALRSEPEVAWAAQCSLFHAARCSDGPFSVRNGTRGTLSRLLLSEPTPFPLCLPQPVPSAVEMYERAFRSDVVRDFISQLRSLAITDPGYDYDSRVDNPNTRYLSFAKFLGRNIGSLQHLRLLGFEDGALTLFLPHMRVPKVKTLHLIGACHTEEAQRAILGLLHRLRFNLVELVFNVWTEFLHDADDPLVDLPVMPNVKQLAVRAPLPIDWQELARKFPALEELTLLYHQDFAINVVEVLESEAEDLSSGSMMDRHVRWLYYDVVSFARDLHTRGFRQLARQCTNLRRLRFAVADTSQGADHTPPDEQLAITWVRERTRHHFRRDEARSNEARAALQSLSHTTGGPVVDPDVGYVTEDKAMAAGATVMLQVARMFDDPSLEASLGLA